MNEPQRQSVKKPCFPDMVIERQRGGFAHNNNIITNNVNKPAPSYLLPNNDLDTATRA